MVKRQKERQYQSSREHKLNSQARSGVSSHSHNLGTVQRTLPFSCCALTLTAFTNPVLSLQSGAGIVFDHSSLMEFVMKHKKDPVTGKATTTKDIIQLHMDQDEQERGQCPVLTKPFADHTKIVAIIDRKAKEGYVYSYEAYKEL